MFNPLYQGWYSSARFDATMSVMSCFPNDHDDMYVVDQLAYMDAPELIPAGSMYDAGFQYDEEYYSPLAMETHAERTST